MEQKDKNWIEEAFKKATTIEGKPIGVKNCLRLKLYHGIAITQKDRESLLEFIDNA